MASEAAKLLSQEILAAVRENTARLTGCPGPQHNFVQIEDKIFSRYRCTICGGTVDMTAAHWYQRGLAHAKR